MSALEQAIKDAVDKGGYRRRNQRWDGISSEDSRLPSVSHNAILLDPAFWSALGKARGWDAGDGQFYNCASGCGCKEEDIDMGIHNGNHSGAECVFEPSRTLNNWHNLIDHLASGKDVESFFEGL